MKTLEQTSSRAVFMALESYHFHSSSPSHVNQTRTLLICPWRASIGIQDDWLSIYESLAEIHTEKRNVRRTRARAFRRGNWRPLGRFVNFRIRALFRLIQLLKCETSRAFLPAGICGGCIW